MEKRRLIFPLLVSLGLLLAALSDRVSAQTELEPFRQEVNAPGLRLTLQVDHTEAGKLPGWFTEGDDLRIGFEITDSTGEYPLAGLFPAAWMELTAAGEGPPVACEQKVRTFLGGNLFSKAERDLNAFFVVSLNRDASLTVVDPLFSFGGSRLLAMVPLDAPGDDWCLSLNQERLFISLPSVDRIAVVDTNSWQMVESIAVPAKPGRLMLQPDGRFLWIAHGKGVAALDVDNLRLSSTFETGDRPSDLVITEDNKWLFAANGRLGNVSRVDLRGRRLAGEFTVGKDPVSLAYSTIADCLLVVNRGSGELTIIDTKAGTLTKRIDLDTGIRLARFAPDGLLAFIINPKTNRLAIFDAATQRIVQSGTVAREPSQISFSDQLAFIQHAADDLVYMVPLGEVGSEGKPIPLIDFPGALQPLPAHDETLIQTLVASPTESAVMFPNPQDESVFYYREGMAAPSGEFKNYGHHPRSVMVLDRGLRELQRPGLYETRCVVDKPGTYEVVFFLENPRVVHCFQVTVHPNQRLEAERLARKVEVQFLNPVRDLSLEQATTFEFRLRNGKGFLHSGADDVVAMWMTPGGTWHRRMLAKPTVQGTYRAAFLPPRRGVYYLYVTCQSAGLLSHDSQYLVLDARARTQALPTMNAQPTEGLHP